MAWGLTWIIGAGPSATACDLMKLTGGRSLVLNDAAWHFEADAFFTNDFNYARDVRDKIDGFQGACHIAIKPRPELIREFDGWLGVRKWLRVQRTLPTSIPGKLADGEPEFPSCTGVVALNLAAALNGFHHGQRIVLWGYDFHDDYRYFYQGDPHPRVDPHRVRVHMERLAPFYRSHGITIVNANPESAIMAFPKITPQEAFENWSS